MDVDMMSVRGKKICENLFEFKIFEFNKKIRINPNESELTPMNPNEPEEIRVNPKKSEWTRSNPSKSEWGRMNPNEAEWTRMYTNEANDPGWSQMNLLNQFKPFTPGSFLHRLLNFLPSQLIRISKQFSANITNNFLNFCFLNSLFLSTSIFSHSSRWTPLHLHHFH